MSGRRASRRTALFLLYQWDITGQPLASLYEGEVDPFARTGRSQGRLDAALCHLREALVFFRPQRIPRLLENTEHPLARSRRV